ncbi:MULTISPECIES: DUF4435 domain-containing protein [unclassified Acinetobacter]|uniref:DUF4435 domain-containing protein n=1 Tax=unclassified Acinetobacter TaxID=196816 RepID=UPI0028817C20|nr:MULTISPECIES: DUF4435 domain-containing protein [unclassified Acinetobacter]MDT0199987.1 DUF4435 domain-containing protein [Acinetobacter sp. RG5]MDT0231421.1 DUF4435 domain-containing protein [Acinetobacter sp. RRD8]
MSEISVVAQDLLNRANNLPTKYFQEFTRVVASEEYDFIVCIEGNDQPYYVVPCSSFLESNNIYYLRCNGKKNVTDLIDILENSDQESYRKSKCFGLVDKDYGIGFNNVYPHRIYETPCYSYENFYLSLSCFRKILEAHFNVKKFNDFYQDYEVVLSNYTARLKDYIDIIKEVDKRYRATRISAKVLNEELPKYYSADVNLNSIKIELDKISFVSGKNIDSCFNKDISLSYSIDSYNAAIKEYNHNDLGKYIKDIRGKFLINFLCSYIRKLIDDINNIQNPICFKQRNLLKKTKSLEKQYFYKVQLSFDNSSIVSSISQYADQPDCLKEFLQKFKSQSLTMAA